MECINIMVFIWRSPKERLLHTWWLIYACMFFAIFLRLRATSHGVPSPKSQVWHGCLHGNSFRRPEIGVVYLLHLGVWTDVELHHVLEVEKRLWHRLLRDALWREARGQLWKCPRGSHHQALRPHPLYNLHDQVHVWWRLSHCLKLLLVQQERSQFCNFVPRWGGSISKF
jgi:hypothetical protein